jgi:hypothetical protein
VGRFFVAHRLAPRQHASVVLMRIDAGVAFALTLTAPVAFASPAVLDAVVSCGAATGICAAAQALWRALSGAP